MGHPRSAFRNTRPHPARGLCREAPGLERRRDGHRIAQPAERQWLQGLPRRLKRRLANRLTGRCADCSPHRPSRAKHQVRRHATPARQRIWRFSRRNRHRVCGRRSSRRLCQNRHGCCRKPCRWQLIGNRTRPPSHHLYGDARRRLGHRRTAV